MAHWIDVWNSKEWREDTAAWIDAACEAYGIHREGEIEFWPAALQQISALVHTDAADLVFTANAPGLSAEPSITVVAGELVPERVVMPLAIDRNAGYMLSPDFGHTMDALETTVENWEFALRSLASLQVALMGQEEAFFDAGMPVIDPQFLPDQFDQALMLHVSLDDGHPLGITGTQADELFSGTHALREACELLHASPVPLSIEHGAFGLDQVVIPAEPGTPGRILGLGAAHWAHPLSSLAQPLGEMCELWNCDIDDERIMRALFAYLEEFSDYGTPDELYPLIAPACLVAPLAQHESWLRLLVDADTSEIEHFAPQILQTLKIG
ncbi:hypothetical protein OK351_14430 [Glutamicibacter sp. MNS18]|uniref:hypothetical protein n=1 Tax=Glutamicibacter sp. MNS18 TaxID=2989817 RepID=UPI002236AC1F|nr:hypothetical protein [Glutamicibacter sp. MNS18]MCW4466688.1 hypothetical protein [Glutamicibacter sp. MNS18]